MKLSLELTKCTVQRETDDKPCYRNSQLFYHIKNKLNGELNLTGRNKLVKKEIEPRTKRYMITIGCVKEYEGEVITIFDSLGRVNLYKDYNNFEEITLYVMRYCKPVKFFGFGEVNVELGLIKPANKEKAIVKVIINIDKQTVWETRELRPSPLHRWDSIETVHAAMDFAEQEFDELAYTAYLEGKGEDVILKYERYRDLLQEITNEDKFEQLCNS